MKKLTKFKIVFGIALVLFAGGVNIAQADSTYVSGELNKSGSLVKYDYTRTHTFTGPISLYVDDMTSGYFRLGLRNMRLSGEPQFTDSLQWNGKGIQEWRDIPQGIRFAIQGRMQPCGWFCDYKWGGHLTY